ncbi:MAG: peptide deformylase [Ignavibacteria bacterium]|nr:peptide deformylase [Ignavibacteria bacterium]
MAVLKITQYGDDILTKKAVPVEKIDTALIGFINDMFDSMINADGVGLAANQVGSNKSIFVIDLSEVRGFERYGKMTFINPKITHRSDETIIMEEGCLSLPNLRQPVERPESITITFQDISLKPQALEADGFLARVIQHEYDHLQGKYFTDRIEDNLKKEVKDYLIKVRNREVECDYPITPRPVVKKKGTK